MVSKTSYIKRFKELYQLKTGGEITDLEALAYFEQLATLVRTITNHVPISQVTLQPHE